MLDVSWGETFILIGLSVSFIGRKDLPKASKFLGNQVGRLVGILQGARARADLFAQNNELHALQNELRSGLRELDTVKGELAVAASSRGLIGRGLGSTIVPSSSLSSLSSTTDTNTNTTTTTIPFPNNPMFHSDHGTTSSSSSSSSSSTTTTTNTSHNQPFSINLAPRYQSVAAVAEEEWKKRGIGFKSKAEQARRNMGVGLGAGAGVVGVGGGSTLLADFMQQNLIHDQYDRAVMEQDLEIRERMEKAQNKRKGAL